jgi:hypothetical protein
MKFKSLSLALATTALVALTLPVLAEDAQGTERIGPPPPARRARSPTMAMAQELYAHWRGRGRCADRADRGQAGRRSPKATEGTRRWTPATIEEAGQEALAKRKAAPGGPAAPAPMMNGRAAQPAMATYQSAPQPDDDGAADGPVTADAMFAKAKELAGDDDVLKA